MAGWTNGGGRTVKVRHPNGYETEYLHLSAISVKAGARIGQGDLVHIPPDAVHSLRPLSDHAPIHCFCFAVGVKDAGEVDYTSH